MTNTLPENFEEKIKRESDRMYGGLFEATQYERDAFIEGGMYAKQILTTPPVAVPDEKGSLADKIIDVVTESNVLGDSFTVRKNKVLTILASTQPTKDWSEIEKRVREKFEIGERGRTFKVPIDELMEFLKDNLPSKEGGDAENDELRGINEGLRLSRNEYMQAFEYWKKRCEAAELVYVWQLRDEHADQFYEAFKTWQSLKSNQSGE